MKKLSAILVIVAGISWGSSCLFVQKLTDMGFSSLQSTSIRVFFAALILNLMLVIKGRGVKFYKISPFSYLLAAITGVGSVFAMSAFYYACMTRTSAAVSVILLYTAPVFVMIMSLIFFKEKLSVQKMTAFVVAIVGCALVSGIASGATVSLSGIIFGLLSGFSYSVYGILTSFFMKKNDEPLTFSALSFAFAAMAAVLVCKPWQVIGIISEQPSLLSTLLLFVAFSSFTAVIPFVLYTEGVTKLSPSVASILAFSEPVTAAVFGAFLLGQRLDAFGVLGMLLVIVAIVILNLKTRKAENVDES